MSRYLIIERKMTQFAKYAGKMFNVWLDRNISDAPSAKLASGKNVKLKIDEKEHRLIINRVGLLVGDMKFYTVPSGTGDVELQVDVDANGKLSIRKKPGKKSSGSRAGNKTGTGTKSKTPAKTSRDIIVVRGSKTDGILPVRPIRMGVDYNTPPVTVYEFLPDTMYTIHSDKKAHDLVFYYPDVETGDIVLKTMEAGSKNLELLVDFDEHGVLKVIPLPPSVKAQFTGEPSGTSGSTSGAGSSAGDKSGIAASPTAAAVKEYIGYHLNPAKGNPAPVLLHALKISEYLRVSVTSDAVKFFVHNEGKEEQNVVTLPYAHANKDNLGTPGQFSSLNTLSQRNQLLAAIRDYVNSQCPGISMQAGKIYLKNDADVPAGSGKAGKSGNLIHTATKGKKTTTPDLSESLTYNTLHYEFMNCFDEESEFAADLDKVAKTCLMSVEDDRLKVTIMVEDFETAQALPDGGTQVMEWIYSRLDTRPLVTYGEVTEKALNNQFDILEREEDRQTIMENFLYALEAMPHLIVEGNTFRSRRKGEELIDVAHSLTTAAMKHKILKMFTPDSSLVDVLRYANVDFCQVAAYEECVSFIYIDRDGETCEKFTYDFEELVGPELLESEDCFGRLRYGYEEEMLSNMIGQALGTLPHLNVEYDVWVRVNPEVIPKTSAVYVKKEEPAKPSLADSPTTMALLAQLAEYFREGSMFDQMLKSGMYERISLNTGGSNAALGFWKKAEDGSQTACGTMILDYAHFGAGQEGSFTELDMDQQDELEEIVWNAFPFLRN